MKNEGISWFVHCREGVRIRIYVAPNSSVNKVDGLFKDADGRLFLKIRISAVAEKGKANQMVRKFLAEIAGCSATSILLISGEKARQKTFLVKEGELLVEKITTMLAMAN